jgi:hypothetical protein
LPPDTDGLAVRMLGKLPEQALNDDGVPRRLSRCRSNAPDRVFRRQREIGDQAIDFRRGACRGL